VQQPAFLILLFSLSPSLSLSLSVLPLPLSVSSSSRYLAARLAFTADGFARNLESRQNVVSHDRRGGRIS
jgi:hypothetical protein